MAILNLQKAKDLTVELAREGRDSDSEGSLTLAAATLHGSRSQAGSGPFDAA